LQKKKNENWEKQEETHKKYTEKVTSKLAENEADKETKMRQEYDKMITNIRTAEVETSLRTSSNLIFDLKINKIVK
jgi:hypothetical protein